MSSSTPRTFPDKPMHVSEATLNKSAGAASQEAGARSELSAPMKFNFMRRFAKKLSISELEELLVVKIAEAMTFGSENSELRQRLEKQEKINENIQKQLEGLRKQHKDLEMLYNRVMKDLRDHPEAQVQPIKITRNVRLQVYCSKRKKKNSTQGINKRRKMSTMQPSVDIDASADVGRKKSTEELQLSNAANLTVVAAREIIGSTSQCSSSDKTSSVPLTKATVQSANLPADRPTEELQLRKKIAANVTVASKKIVAPIESLKSTSQIPKSGAEDSPCIAAEKSVTKPILQSSNPVGDGPKVGLQLRDRTSDAKSTALKSVFKEKTRRLTNQSNAVEAKPAQKQVPVTKRQTRQSSRLSRTTGRSKSSAL